MSRRARIVPLLAVGILLGGNLAVLGSLHVLWANSTEFSSQATTVLPHLLGPGFLLSLVVVGLGLAVPTRSWSPTLSVLLTVAVLLWLQAAFLSRGYGEFDGRELERTVQPWWRSLDLLLWAAAITVALRYHRPIGGVVTTVGFGLTIGLLVAGWFSRAPHDASKTADAIPPDGLFEVSQQGNVFHVLLDSFQTDMFAELVAEEGWADAFDGFTLYRQNMGVARWTTYALPAIFTGRLYTGQEPYETYYQRGMIQESFHHHLADAGYRVNLVYQRPMTHRNVTHAFSKSLVYGLQAGELAHREAMQLLDVSLFRAVPHLLRERVYNRGNWFLLRTAAQPPTADSFHQKAFFNDYIDRLDPVLDHPSYHFVHLMPPHPPYATLEDGSFAGEALPQSRPNYKNEARAILKVFVRFLARLESLGIRDSSVILLQGDHGAIFPPRVDGREVEMPQTRVPALLAFKPPSSHGPLRFSDAPTSLLDVGPTILEATGVTANFPGRSITAIPEGEIRERPFFVVDEANTETPVLTNFLVRGDVFDIDSWRQLGSVAVMRAGREYEWGTEIKFGLSGNADGYRGTGWSTPSSAAEWTDGNLAELHFEFEPPDRHVRLEVTLLAYVVEDLVPRQRIEVYANEVVLARTELRTAEPTMFRSYIPPHVMTEGKLTLRFVLPDAASPSLVGTGGDQRHLGIFVFSLDMTPDDPPARHR